MAMATPALTARDDTQFQPDTYSGTAVLSHPPVAQDDFAVGLCQCGGSFCDAFFCYYCQQSRQINMLLNEQPRFVSIDPPGYNVCVDDSLGCARHCFIRKNVRKRYQLREAPLEDCCVVCWCPCCALNQTHWEMALRGDDPGAMCSCGEVSIPSAMR